jgi:hypothetical protein
MSKIYEALRQAELDRANAGVVRFDSGSNPQATSQAVLEETPGSVHIPPFSNAGRALATLTPVPKLNGNAPAESLADSKIALTAAGDAGS